MIRTLGFNDSSLKYNAFNVFCPGMNYSTTGFQLLLTRKMSFYIVTYYLPSGLFVVVSWIRSDSSQLF